MAKIVTAVEEWVGIILEIKNGDYELPSDFTLPAEISLRAAHVRERGTYLGQRWYFQSWGRVASPAISLVTPEEIDGSLEICKEFAAAHGYTCDENDPERIYSRK